MYKHRGITIFICCLCISACSFWQGNYTVLTNRTVRGIAGGAATGAVVGSVSAVGAPIGAAFGGVAGSIIGYEAEKRASPAQKINELLASEGIQVIQKGETFRIIIPEQKLFVPHTPRQLSTAPRVYDLITRFMRQFDIASVEVAGYTSDNGDASRNLALSRAWARTVADVLRLYALDIRLIYARGYGEAEPIADNARVVGQMINDRIEIHYRTVPRVII